MNPCRKIDSQIACKFNKKKLLQASDGEDLLTKLIALDLSH